MSGNTIGYGTVNTGTEQRKHKKQYKYMRHGRRKRKLGNIKDSRGILPNRISFDLRPEIVYRRGLVEDIELGLTIRKVIKVQF